MITVYHYRTAGQEKSLDDFLENALLPFYHNKGIKYIGAFKPLSNDTAADKTLYVIVPPVFRQAEIADLQLQSDAQGTRLVTRLQNTGTRHLRPMISWFGGIF